jgi:hypothetical protein
MAEILIAGSNEVWRQSAHEMLAGPEDEGNVVIREEVRKFKESDTEKELVT